MARFSVSIGDAEGREGDKVTVQATNAAAARAQVLASKAMIDNPHWEITSEPEELK